MKSATGRTFENIARGDTFGSHEVVSFPVEEEIDDIKLLNEHEGTLRCKSLAFMDIGVQIEINYCQIYTDRELMSSDEGRSSFGGDDNAITSDLREDEISMPSSYLDFS